MTNSQLEIRDSLASLGIGEGIDFGYAYTERLGLNHYNVQTYSPLEDLQFNFEGAIERIIEVANQDAPASRVENFQVPRAA